MTRELPGNLDWVALGDFAGSGIVWGDTVSANMSEEIGRAEAAEMMRVMADGWIARLEHAAAELRLADHIANGASDPDALAKAAGVHKASLARVLRALAAIGVSERARTEHTH